MGSTDTAALGPKAYLKAEQDPEAFRKQEDLD